MNKPKKSSRKLDGLEQQIIEEYKTGISCNSLGKKYNVSNVTIINLLQRSGIARRTYHDAMTKYPYDEYFFEIIDTEEKAYFLGLMYADGYNNQKENSISLTLTDYELVESFRKALQTNHPIYEYGSSTRPGYIGKDCYSLKIFGKNISSNLANKGCYQGKSLTLKFPNENVLPTQLIHHFCRGYFDGDGCIHIRKQGNNKVVHICGTEHFCMEMAKNLPVDSFVNRRHKAKIWFLGIYKMKDIYGFRDWLYKDAAIFLERKKELFFKNALSDI